MHKKERQQPEKLKISADPWHLACDRDGNIWASDWLQKKVVKIDDNGNELVKISKLRVDGEACWPVGMACKDDKLYIVVRQIDESTNKYIAYKGHIHQYSLKGEYQSCVIQGIEAPRGIAIANGKLYVANTKSVWVYSQI